MIYVWIDLAFIQVVPNPMTSGKSPDPRTGFFFCEREIHCFKKGPVGHSKLDDPFRPSISIRSDPGSRAVQTDQ